jgi:hypothetical protein
MMVYDPNETVENIAESLGYRDNDYRYEDLTQHEDFVEGNNAE